MVKKRRVFIAMFLALAVMLQYSFTPQTFMSYAEETSETNTTEEAAPAPEPASAPAPTAKATSTSTTSSSTTTHAAESTSSNTSSESASTDQAATDSTSESAAANTASEPTATESEPAKATGPAGTDSSADAGKTSGDSKDTGTTNTKSQPAALKAAANETSAKAETADKLTLHITNILWTAKKAVNGHAVAFESTLAINKGAGKTVTATGVLNEAGGKNNTANGLGYTYKFLNVFVLTDKDGEPVYSDSTDGLRTVSKVSFNSAGSAATVTFSDGSTQEISGSDVYITPIYKATANWYLNYHYIDNISTGSGSWSNKDAVSAYSHTFSDPSKKTPVDNYAFCYWQNEDTGVKYYDGDTNTYTSAEMKNGETKDVNVYAYWQPAVIVNYIVDGVKEATSKSLENDIDVYEEYNGEAELSDDDNAFAGWYDKSDSRLAEGSEYDLPEITEKADSYKEYDVVAKWQPAVSVIYNVLGSVVDEVKNTSGDSVNVYDKTADSSVDGVTFEGWYDADGNRISDDTVYDAPGITSKRDQAVSYNVFARFATSRSVQKVWDDGNNADGIRTGSVNVQLYANGEPTGKFVTLDSANSWAAAFANLDAYDADGNLIEYTINEEGVPAGYSASITADGTTFTVTNTHTPTPAPTPADHPGTDPTPGGNGGGPAGGGIITAAAGGTGTAVITANPTPKAPATTIDDPKPPLAANAYWALINLLCAIATALLSLIMLIRYFGKRKEEEEVTNPETGATITREVDEQRKGKLRIASIIPAIGAIIAFILTEDMTLPMQMVDKWTVMMVVILAIQVLVAIFANVRREEDDAQEAAA